MTRSADRFCSSQAALCLTNSTGRGFLKDSCDGFQHPSPPKIISRRPKRSGLECRSRSLTLPTEFFPEPFTRALTQRGVSPGVASEIVDRFLVESVQSQIALFAWLLKPNDAKLLRNPPGYLVAAIRDGYCLPPAFVSHQNEANRHRRAKTTCRSLRAPANRIPRSPRPTT